MSGRLDLDDVIAVLYQAVDDDQLCWLDDLLIAAGYRRRCPCSAMAPADQSCPVCGAGTVDFFFDIHRTRPQAVFTIAASDHGDPPIVILIGAAGGDTLGKAHSGNTWIYSVLVDDTLWYSGADLRCGAIAHSHSEIAGAVATWLSERVGVPERWRQRLGDWARAQGGASR
jgi:hypothetical protein